MPETPAINLFGVGYSDDSFNATWDDPLIPNGRIRRYRVYYTVDKKEPLSDWSIAYAGLNWMIIRRLERHQVYYFKIQVVGYAGLGPMSTEVAVVKAQAGGRSFSRHCSCRYHARCSLRLVKYMFISRFQGIIGILQDFLCMIRDNGRNQDIACCT